MLLASRGGCETISASHCTGLGDKGNPQITKELDKLGEMCYFALLYIVAACFIGLLFCKFHLIIINEISLSDPQAVEENIPASPNTALGGEGNPQVKKELGKLGEISCTYLCILYIVVA